MHWTIILCSVALTIGLGFLGHATYKAIVSITNTSDQISSTISNINGPNGTITRINHLVTSTNILLRNSDAVVAHEQKQLTTLDHQEGELFKNVNNLLISSNSTVGKVGNVVDTINLSAQTLNTNLESSNVFLHNITTTDQSLNTILSNPDIQTFIKATSDTAVQVDGIAGNTNKITSHFEKVVDGKKSFWPKTINVIKILVGIGSWWR